MSEQDFVDRLARQMGPDEAAALAELGRSLRAAAGQLDELPLDEVEPAAVFDVGDLTSG